MNPDYKLEACKRSRKVAQQSLKRTLQKVLKSKKPISEADFRDMWLSEMRQSKSIFPAGWYDPPPHGIIVFFGSDKDVRRTHYTSARPKEFWPRKDIFLDRESGIILLYASPMDRKTGIIGDFEMTLYLGKNKKIQSQVKKTLQITYGVGRQIKVGEKLKNVVISINQLFDKYGLFNDVYSISDNSSDNMGHSIPFSYENMNKDEERVFKKGSWKNKCKLIANKRIYVTSQQDFQIKPSMAFTIEPRSRVKDDPSFPLIMFHTIILVNSKGKKEILTGFEEIFEVAGMNYMLK